MKAKVQCSENDIIEISKGCIKLLEDKKASNIVLLDLRAVNSYLDYFLITTANSYIHCRSLAKEVQKFCALHGLKGNNKPDLHSGWIILDYFEIIIHIFTEEMRGYYQLEKLWADAEKLY